MFVSAKTKLQAKLHAKRIQSGSQLTSKGKALAPHHTLGSNTRVGNNNNKSAPERKKKNLGILKEVSKISHALERSTESGHGSGCN